MSTTKVKIDFDSFQEAKAVLEGELKDNQAIESFKTREFITKVEARLPPFQIL